MGGGVALDALQPDHNDLSRSRPHCDGGGVNTSAIIDERDVGVVFIIEDQREISTSQQDCLATLFATEEIA